MKKIKISYYVPLQAARKYSRKNMLYRVSMYFAPSVLGRPAFIVGIRITYGVAMKIS